MQRSLQALVNSLFDYAGLFPPANLPLEEAVHNYSEYRAGADAWMLGRFVCPAAKLMEAGPLLAQRFTAEAPARLVVLGAENLLSPEVVKDVRLLEHFRRAHGEIAVIEALEALLPLEIVNEWPPAAISEGLNVLAGRLVDHEFRRLQVFLEPTRDERLLEVGSRLIRALRTHNESRGEPDPARVGLKLRMGGAAVAAYPTPHEVATILRHCAENGVPLKFTAGMHHPLRRFSETVQTDEHGFVNVFAAGVCMHARGVDVQRAEALLQARDSSEFTFDSQMLRWQDLEASIDEIELARREFVVSVGSCSFAEPREDLKKLGWW